jgi:hypothetical protein
MEMKNNDSIGDLARGPFSHVPEPVFDKEPAFVELYTKAWEIASGRVKSLEGLPQTPYMDEACWDTHIWIWDTAFMALFTKYSPQRFPGVESLKNFYLTMHDGKKQLPIGIQHPDNPPLFAWCEYSNWRFNQATSFGRGKKAAETSLDYMIRHYLFFDHVPRGTRFGGAPTVLERICDEKGCTKGYLWNGVSSGMDNTPRPRVFGLKDTLWVDALAQQGLSALYIARLACEIGHQRTAEEYLHNYEQIKKTVNDLYWDPEDGAYYDIHRESEFGSVHYSRVLTPASFWPLLAEMASPGQALDMLKHLGNDNKLGGKIPFVTLSRDDQDFNADSGDYWRGAIWLPTSYMGIKALEIHGYLAEADEIAEKTVRHMLDTYHNPAAHSLNKGKPTVWECYNPSQPLPSTEHGRTARPDFCGWSALGPISLLIENILGFHVVDACQKRIEWRLHQEGRHGIKRLRFGDIVVDIVYDGENEVAVQSNERFTIVINGSEHRIEPGINRILMNENAAKEVKTI